MKPTLAITMGDPAGIGPEVALKAAAHPSVRRVCRPLLFGDPVVWHRVARTGGLKISSPIVSAPMARRAAWSRMGGARATAEGGRMSAEAIQEAVSAALSGDVDGVVTAPINKTSWALAGIREPGHTELLARLTRAPRVAMMFWASLGSRECRVSLVTRHLALRAVSRQITVASVRNAVELTINALRQYWGIQRPRLLVTALNPHGGRDELFGDEERRIIRPAMTLCRHLRADLHGPVPADSAFAVAWGSAGPAPDAVVAMYHDQGLIPFKLLAFDRGVNVTLGLPFVRTSPDHGTAYDIARKGVADPRSMIEAVCLAAVMVKSARLRPAGLRHGGSR